jgi:hypothetical protein
MEWLPLPIDWARVDWVTVATLSGIAFIAAVIANILSLGSRLVGAVLTGVVYAVLYVVWTYYLRAQVFGTMTKAAMIYYSAAAAV